MSLTRFFLTGLLPHLLGMLISIGVFILLLTRFRDSFRDKSKGEPTLTEEALVHAKSDHGTRLNHIYIIHFYIAARDTVVNCEVPKQIWFHLEKGQRGTLCHQGGKFHSFKTEDYLYRNTYITGY